MPPIANSIANLAPYGERGWQWDWIDANGLPVHLHTDVQGQGLWMDDGTMMAEPESWWAPPEYDDALLEISAWHWKPDK